VTAVARSAVTSDNSPPGVGIPATGCAIGESESRGARIDTRPSASALTHHHEELHDERDDADGRQDRAEEDEHA
jgi:hypothetical protein